MAVLIVLKMEKEAFVLESKNMDLCLRLELISKRNTILMRLKIFHQTGKCLMAHG